jgi:membrane fusion protein, multidrug efflux system
MHKAIRIGATILVIGLSAGAGVFARHGMPAAARNKASEQSAPPAIPVTAAHVQQHDVPIVLEGLGTVVPLNAATIRAQVQGTLESVDSRARRSSAGRC